VQFEMHLKINNIQNINANYLFDFNLNNIKNIVYGGQNEKE